MACYPELSDPRLSRVVPKNIMQCDVRRKVQEFIYVDESDPPAVTSGTKSTVCKACFLSLYPGPQMAGDIVIGRRVHGLEHLLCVIIAVVIVDEPPFDAEA